MVKNTPYNNAFKLNRHLRQLVGNFKAKGRHDIQWFRAEEVTNRPAGIWTSIFGLPGERSCDWVGGSEQKRKGDATPIHSVLSGLHQYNSTNGDQICRAFGHIFAY